MNKNVNFFLQHSNEIQNLIKENFVSNVYSYSYFDMDREEFIDVFQVRLQISESKYNNGMGNPVSGLRNLVENVKKSTLTDRILCISIENEEINILIYTNVSLTEIYGYIF